MSQSSVRWERFKAGVNGVPSCAVEIPEREKLCGVYFLMDGDECVYIGQSCDIESRLATHKSQGLKKWDRALCLTHHDFWELSDEFTRMDVEGVFGQAIRPKYNIKCNGQVSVVNSFIAQYASKYLISRLTGVPVSTGDCTDANKTAT